MFEPDNIENGSVVDIIFDIKSGSTINYLTGVNMFETGNIENIYRSSNANNNFNTKSSSANNYLSEFDFDVDHLVGVDIFRTSNTDRSSNVNNLIGVKFDNANNSLNNDLKNFFNIFGPSNMKTFLNMFKPSNPITFFKQTENRKIRKPPNSSSNMTETYKNQDNKNNSEL
ncbi:22109_t:CDS:2 [Racocetra persica]|uniref:22109_t:CDS:1 n=1 Tax=Racocetra persica TaxID=160502 RepID=A0ACA9N528_9GLOM|nr:22109_t:CDS:2 [Racocetra persica]